MHDKDVDYVLTLHFKRYYVATLFLVRAELYVYCFTVCVLLSYIL
jgi:hypothetical protein